jgi:predicted Zn-dependent protease
MIGWRWARVVAAGAIAASAVAACAGRGIRPIGADGRPFAPDVDERRLWSQAEREEASLRTRTEVEDDPRLVEYLTAMAEGLVPEPARAAGAPAVRVTVLRDPTLNAFAMPNGVLYIHTGLLAKVENASQLAAIVSRAVAHVTARHALAFARSIRGRTAFHRLLGVGASAAAAASQPGADGGGAAVLSPTANAVLGLRLELMAAAAITGYGRDLERAADAAGVERLVAAGYDPEEAPRVFRLLQSERAERGPIEVFFLGNSPRLQERVESMTILVRGKYARATPAPAAPDAAADFATRLRPVLRDNAQLDIRAGRFTLAQAQLDRVIRAAPDDAVAHLYYGDLHRLRSQRAAAPKERAELAAKAEQAYERASALDPTLAEPFRGLGLLYYEQKQPAKAREALERYLALRPGAEDAPRIREYLTQLDR